MNQMNMADSILFSQNPTLKEQKKNSELLFLHKSINGNTSVPRIHITKDGMKLSFPSDGVDHIWASLTGLLIAIYDTRFDDSI